MQSVTRKRADSNRTPPALRRWVSQRCRGVTRFARFSDDCETIHRGWSIRCQAHPEEAPEGFSIVKSTIKENSGGEYLYVQVREDR